MAAEKYLREKTVHLALPVRWSMIRQQNRGPAEAACTYDIDAKGARLVSSRPPNVGDLITLERGRTKAICQVTWAGDPNSPLRGQFAVQCVDGKAPWEDEWRQAEEEFMSFDVDALERGPFGRHAVTHQNRRRRPRYNVEGRAEMIEKMRHASGDVVEISEFGARISAEEQLRPGADFRLALNLFDVRLALKARVRYLVNNFGMGVEFQEIRRGDRPLLGYVLNRLKRRRVEDFVEVEVVTERLVRAAAV
jgi:PilZ domain